MKKLYKRLGVLILLGIIGLYIALTHILPYSILKPGKQNCILTADSEIEAIKVAVSEEIDIVGNYLLADSAIGSLILVHGVGSCKESYENTQYYFAELGINTYAFDMRAHGKSGGDYATYGYHEKKDIEKLVEQIEEIQGHELPLGILGKSMGGAIAVQAMAEIEEIDFGIFQSAFAHFPEIVNDYAERLFKGLTMKWMVDWTLSEAGEIAAFDPEEVSPEKAAQKIDKPVLIIHGDQDERIDVSHAYRIFDNIASSDKELYIVEGGKHIGLSNTAGRVYFERLNEFILNQNLLSKF
ncbi:MAG: alpha/beta fold hydrolase [Bacteroidota bacterium]